MNAISTLGARTGLHHAHHGHRAKATDQASPIDPLAAATDTDDSDPSILQAQASPTTGAGGLAASLLSKSTLETLLGLQTVNGQAQGGGADPTAQATRDLV